MSGTSLTTTSGPDGFALAEQQKKMHGPEKAAVVFLCLGEKRGAELMKKLGEGDIQKITKAMSGLGVISAAQVEEVMVEFSERVSSGSGVIGSLAIAENMLRSFLPEEKVDAVLKDIRGPIKERDLWAKFSAQSEITIANYLQNEHEQTVAAILTKLNSEMAAKILPLLGAEKAQDVIERMINMESVPQHMMEQIEESLQSDILTASSQPSESDMQQRMANLFNRLDPDLFGKISSGLEGSMGGAFEGIKKKMFTFDDLIRLDAQSLAKVMRGVDGTTLPLALRGADKEMRDHFLGALPARSRDMLADEMSAMGPVRGRDARVAQLELVSYTKSLIDDEQIALPLNEDEEDEEEMLE